MNSTTQPPVDAIILAGGFGTRIASRAGDLPKALIPVCGRPFLSWQLELLKRQGVRSVTYLLGHRAQAIETFLAGWRLEHPGFVVRTLHDPDGEPVGTGRAVRSAVERLGGELSDAFFLSYGDSYLETGWSEAIAAYHAARQATESSTSVGVMSVVAAATPDTAPNIAWSDGQLKLYTKKPSAQERPMLNAVDHGIMILEKRCVLESFASTGKFDLSAPLEQLSRVGGLVGAHLDQHYFEIGTPEGLDRLSAHLWAQSLVLLDRDGVINAMVERPTEPSGQDSPLALAEIQILPGVSEALARLRHCGAWMALCTNQPAAAKGKISTKALNEIHTQIEAQAGLLGTEWRGRYLGAQICFHRAEDACSCRKPRPGLLLSALESYRKARGTDPVCVWMAGDRLTDLQAGDALSQTWGGPVELLGLGAAQTFAALPKSARVATDLSAAFALLSV